MPDCVLCQHYRDLARYWQQIAQAEREQRLAAEREIIRDKAPGPFVLTSEPFAWLEQDGLWVPMLWDDEHQIWVRAIG